MTTYTACPNTACERGAVTTMVGKIIGRSSNGHEVRSETFMVPMKDMCPVCKGRGRVTVGIEAEPVEEPTPGFTRASFQRAIQRAHAVSFTLGCTDRAGVFIVSRGDTVYVTSSTACSCKAGQVGMGCKHRHEGYRNLTASRPSRSRG